MFSDNNSTGKFRKMIYVKAVGIIVFYFGKIIAIYRVLIEVEKWGFTHTFLSPKDLNVNNRGCNPWCRLKTDKNPEGVQ